MTHRAKVLIFIVAYNAENTIRKVLTRIPEELFQTYAIEILIIDDASRDRTFESALEETSVLQEKCTLTVLANPINQGYGGNQKLGLHYAVQNHFDVVALLHGDGQYAPEYLPELIAPLANNQADLVLGSRMIKRQNALRGGMPLYKFIGNIILTTYQNLVLGLSLSEFHSGYRLYAVGALRELPFHLNTQDFHFDTEIIIQMAMAGKRIQELPIPTFYGDEICHVNGLRYAWNVVRVSFQALLQRKGLGFQARFDLSSKSDEAHAYEATLGFVNTHSMVVNQVPPGSRVLDVGCGEGYIAEALRNKGCRIVGMDRVPPHDPLRLDHFIQTDINQTGLSACSLEEFDRVLLLNVVEYLQSPEGFVDDLLQHREINPELRVIVTTGNVAFCATRLQLLLGNFDYGKRGILKLTHSRLFTFKSILKLFEEHGCSVEQMAGIPAPFPLVFGDNRFSRFLIWVNLLLIKLSKGLFSYQIMLVLRPRTTLQRLLITAREFSSQRAERFGAALPRINDAPASQASATGNEL